VLSGDLGAISRFSFHDFEVILAVTLSSMSVDQFAVESKRWIDAGKDRRWNRPYIQFTYLPMHELLKYMRPNGYKTYTVTGGGRDFVRV
jgi:hypothetical protein